MTTLADLTTALERAYPPESAESWDAIGLVCGDPDQPVTRVHVCVDPVESTVDEAITGGAQLIVAHHPLLLRGVHGVPANTQSSPIKCASSQTIFSSAWECFPASPWIWALPRPPRVLSSRRP